MIQAQLGRWLGRAGLAVALAIGLGGVEVGCWGDDSAQSKIGQPVASCPGLSPEIEKTIKADPELAKLDHYVDITYKTAVSLAIDDGEKLKIQGEQCNWHAAVNKCKNMSCIKPILGLYLNNFLDENFQKYKANLDIGICPEAKFETSEADKELCINRQLSKNNYKLAQANIETDRGMCQGFLESLKAHDGKIKFIEPVTHTDDINDPLLQPYADCNDGYHGGDFEFFGNSLEDNHNFRLFRIQIKKEGKIKNIEWLYQENGAMKDNSLIPTYFTSLDFKSCKITKQWMLGQRESQGINSLIKYQGNYFQFECHLGLCSAYLYDFSKDNISDHRCFFRPQAGD